MKLMAMLTTVSILVLPGCGGENGTGRCQGVVCNNPPADACRNSDVLLDYSAPGSCSPDTGECAYEPAEVTCEHGCATGRCLEEDKCRGGVCDQPPANACKNADTLLVYPAVGTCDAATGNCVYEAHELLCDNGCENDTCRNQDLCDDVDCNDPPPDNCADASTLLTYEGTGACNPQTGRCEYIAHEQPCEHGCHQGRCIPEREVWGWIAVLETNDTGGLGWGWNLDVGAYFAAAPNYRRAMPHHSGFFCVEVESAGDCTLYNDGFNTRLDACNPPCDVDQECVYEDGPSFCRDMPEHFDVGTISVEGLKVAVGMQADEYDRYRAEDLPGDLFDTGDVITATTTGGQLYPMSFEARGVAHLETADSRVNLARDQTTTISWTPADSGTRVMVVLMTGSHDPALPTASLICDVADDAGKVIILPSLVNGFLDRHYLIQKTSRIIRYTRDVQTLYGKEIELLVGSSRDLELFTP